MQSSIAILLDLRKINSFWQRGSPVLALPNLASTLILAFAIPVKAEVGSGLGATDHVAGNFEYAKVCTSSRNGRLSLRTEPGQDYRKIKEIANGHTLALNYSEYGNDGFRWLNVSHNGSRGWVRADYVCGDQ